MVLSRELPEGQYGELLARRLKAAMPEAAVEYDPEADDIVLERPSTSKCRVPVGPFRQLFDGETGGRCDSVNGASGGRPAELHTDVDLVRDLYQRNVCSDVVGIPVRRGINDCPELSDGAELCYDFVPTRYELELLAEPWLYELTQIRFHHVMEESVGSEYKLVIFGQRRIDRLRSLLGTDVLKKIETRVQKRLLQENGNNDAWCLFLYGNEQDLEQCVGSVREAYTLNLTEDECKQRLADLRRAAEQRLKESACDHESRMSGEDERNN